MSLLIYHKHYCNLLKQERFGASLSGHNCQVSVCPFLILKDFGNSYIAVEEPV